MLNLEKQLEKEVFKLREKVKGKKGEIVFCLREFNLTESITGDFIPPYSEDFYYYETGIINGKIKKKEYSKMENIALPCFDFKIKNCYCVFGDYSVSIDRKLKGFINKFQNSFYFKIEDLENLKQGKLLIDLKDFRVSLNNLLTQYDNHEPELKNFNLLIGNEEVENFLKKRKIENYQELFGVLKNQDEVKKKIDSHYLVKREELGKKLIVLANEITNEFREIESLEDNVMHASFLIEKGQDETNRYWNKEEVIYYYKIKDNVLKNLKSLNEFLEKGKKLYNLNSEPLINGETIGFPEKISFNSYSIWLKNNLISDINKTFKKIDSYLTEEEKKANC